MQNQLVSAIDCRSYMSVHKRGVLQGECEQRLFHQSTFLLSIKKVQEKAHIDAFIDQVMLINTGSGFGVSNMKGIAQQSHRKRPLRQQLWDIVCLLEL